MPPFFLYSFMCLVMSVNFQTTLYLKMVMARVEHWLGDGIIQQNILDIKNIIFFSILHYGNNWILICDSFLVKTILKPLHFCYSQPVWTSWHVLCNWETSSKDIGTTCNLDIISWMLHHVWYIVLLTIWTYARS